jgi:hypothetical protein
MVKDTKFDDHRRRRFETHTITFRASSDLLQLSLGGVRFVDKNNGDVYMPNVPEWNPGTGPFPSIPVVLSPEEEVADLGS